MTSKQDVVYNVGTETEGRQMTADRVYLGRDGALWQETCASYYKVPDGIEIVHWGHTWTVTPEKAIEDLNAILASIARYDTGSTEEAAIRSLIRGYPK